MPQSLETLLARWREGDAAAGGEVLALAYSELRRLAAFHFRHERPGHTLQPTALVHEVFLKLSGGASIPWQNRAHFFAVFSREVRRVLVDHARRHKALKRRDTLVVLAPALRHGNAGPEYESLLTVDQILADLEQLDPRAAKGVELRVFGGLKESEISNALGISTATVKRDWNFARAWLVTRLQEAQKLPGRG